VCATRFASEQPLGPEVLSDYAGVYANSDIVLPVQHWQKQRGVGQTTSYNVLILD
jgi:hypothetical protein